MGVDLGTSSTKAVIIDLRNGRLLSSAACEYGIDTPQPGWAEQDPAVWYRAAVQTMRQALAESGLPPEAIGGIGLAGQMHSMVCLDRHLSPLRPAIIWADQRSRREVQAVVEQLGVEQLGRWTGNPLATGFMLASWLWLRQNEPGLADAVRWLLLPKDYLRLRLTGELGSEASDAASTSLFDPARRQWSAPLLDALQIDPRRLPPVFASAAVAGGLLAGVAEETGLLAGTPLVFGGSDQAAQALGRGVIAPGQVSATIGAGGQLFAPLDQPRYDPALRLHLFCHVLPQVWHLETATLTAGLSLRWLRDQVTGGRMDYNALADAADGVPPGAEGLFFLPYLAGERTPWMDSQARGAFIGLTLRHDWRHMARAVMEGVVFSMRQGLDLMVEMGLPAERILASGGSTRHPLWVQLIANIFNRPVFVSQTQEATARGAAMLAGIGTGFFKDAADASRQTGLETSVGLDPDPALALRYQAMQDQFIQFYPTLRPFYHL